MLQDPNVERIIENRLKPLQEEINLLKTELVKIKQALNIDIVSEPLHIDTIIINPMDTNGDFEVEIGDRYSYINTEEAKRIIKYLQESINAR